ncbi:OmpA family protein [Caballeronia mineralivorans]|uniref:OmpA family protein n=1 Tax=Caballeronia mineralivorans TaxID=2010198 RepID=UPI00069F53FA|nr:OmpA family protein [Caballeronia mineralivorans]
MAAKTGVSVGATHALSGIVMTTLFGVLKHYFTKADGVVGQLPTLLGHQLPMVKASMTEDIAGALGLGGAGSFLSGVAAQMKAVSSHLDHPSMVGGVSPAVNASLDRIVVEEKVLSKKRAEAVRAFLVKHGVPADSLTAQGFGDAHPVADNATASGRFENRRIDFAVQE